MKGKVIGYWVVTGLFVVGFGYGTVFDAMLMESDYANSIHGMPMLWYSRVFSVLKLAGLAVLLAPGLPRVKEWAYAGFAFGLINVALVYDLHSVFIFGDSRPIAIPILFLALAVGSYVLRPPSRVMGQLFGGQGTRSASTNDEPKVVGYWVVTGLFVVGFSFRTVLDAMSTSSHSRLFSVYELAGLAVLLVPGLPRVKEWAYAGFVFGLIDALMVGRQPIVIPILFLVLAVGSYVLRPHSRVIGQLFEGQSAPSASTNAAPT